VFNSPMHHCILCKQYVALDQSVDECAREHACRIENCPISHLFNPPMASENTQSVKMAKTPGKP
jgi:hypothetical protein